MEVPATAAQSGTDSGVNVYACCFKPLSLERLVYSSDCGINNHYTTHQVQAIFQTSVQIPTPPGSLPKNSLEVISRLGLSILQLHTEAFAKSVGSVRIRG